MKNNIINFLELQAYKVKDIQNRNDQELVIEIEKKKKYKDKCPNCHSHKISRHAKGEFKLKKHGHFQEKLIYLKIKRDRLVCLKCRKVFSEQLPNIKKYARNSDNFLKQSLTYLSKNSFNEVGAVNKMGYQSIKNNLYNYVDPFKLLKEKIKLLDKMDDIYLGLDGQSFRGKDMILTVTEVVRKDLLTILPSELQTDLERFLKLLPANIRSKVKGVAMDMTNKHIRLIKKYLPQALIVIDHYHVVSLAIKHMQSIRRTLQSARNIIIPIKRELDKNKEKLTEYEIKKLERYFKMFPEIKTAYLAKEKIRSIYRNNNYQIAKEELEVLINSLMMTNELDLKELARTLTNWKEEILNYFKCRITNAYTEGLHNKCKLIKRKSYGFRNVETYVRKLILGLLPISFILSYTHFFT
jgi:transposase